MIDPEKLYNKAMEAAEDWADKDYAAGVLEDGLSTLEASLIAEYKAKGEPVSTVAKRVKMDPKWVSMAEAWRDARKAALVARLKYDQINRFIDNCRTKESTERSLAR